MEQKRKNETYYTLSGKVTEDTLSIQKEKELREKIKNNTITEEEREKLRMDDSLQSHRSTTGIYPEDQKKYNPNVEYFMIDYWDKKDCRHVRIPYVTQFNLLGHVRYFVEEGNWLDTSTFRIHSERELDTKLEVKCQDGEYRELTLRQILFDDRYENMSDLFKDENKDSLKQVVDKRYPPVDEYEEEEETV